MAQGETQVQRWRRRCLTIPGFGLLAIAYACLLLVALPIAVVFDLAAGRRMATSRALLAVALYLACEVAGLLAAGLLWLVVRPLTSARAYTTANYRLQRWWAQALLRGATRIFGMRVSVHGAEDIGPGPVLLFVRHASTIDTLLAANFVGPVEPFRLRYVIKRELLWDPCLDVVGQRLPNVFIRRGEGGGEAEIAAIRELARDVDAGEGVLIYPEGTRATPAKQRRALERIAALDADRLDRVSGLRHVLPPRYGGPLGLIEERSDADVVVLTHVGFDGVHNLGELWRGALIGRELRVQLWRVPAVEIPADRAERERWIDAEWKRVDDWVAAQLANAPTDLGHGAR